MIVKEPIINEAVSDLARSLYHKEKQNIRASRVIVRDLEAMRKKYGWRWNKDQK